MPKPKPDEKPVHLARCTRCHLIRPLGVHPCWNCPNPEFSLEAFPEPEPPVMTERPSTVDITETLLVADDLRKSVCESIGADESGPVTVDVVEYQGRLYCCTGTSRTPDGAEHFILREIRKGYALGGQRRHLRDESGSLDGVEVRARMGGLLHTIQTDQVVIRVPAAKPAKYRDQPCECCGSTGDSSGNPPRCNGCVWCVPAIGKQGEKCPKSRAPEPGPSTPTQVIVERGSSGKFYWMLLAADGEVVDGGPERHQTQSEAELAGMEELRRYRAALVIDAEKSRRVREELRLGSREDWRSLPLRPILGDHCEYFESARIRTLGDLADWTDAGQTFDEAIEGSAKQLATGNDPATVGEVCSDLVGAWIALQADEVKGQVPESWLPFVDEDDVAEDDDDRTAEGIGTRPEHAIEAEGRDPGLEADGLEPPADGGLPAGRGEDHPATADVDREGDQPPAGRRPDPAVSEDGRGGTGPGIPRDQGFGFRLPPGVKLNLEQTRVWLLLRDRPGTFSPSGLGVSASTLKQLATKGLLALELDSKSPSDRLYRVAEASTAEAPDDVPAQPGDAVSTRLDPELSPEPVPAPEQPVSHPPADDPPAPPAPDSPAPDGPGGHARVAIRAAADGAGFHRWEMIGEGGSTIKVGPGGYTTPAAALECGKRWARDNGWRFRDPSEDAPFEPTEPSPLVEPPAPRKVVYQNPRVVVTAPADEVPLEPIPPKARNHVRDHGKPTPTPDAPLTVAYVEDHPAGPRFAGPEGYRWKLATPPYTLAERRKIGRVAVLADGSEVQAGTAVLRGQLGRLGFRVEEDRLSPLAAR